MLEATFASNLHHAHTRGRSELDPSIVEHLQQANQLYLACFRDGSIKVGTSTLSRIETRLTEQGAWRALIVADSTDGYAVRIIEDIITERIGVTQAVAATRKLAGLANPVDEASLDAALDSAQQKVHEIIASFGEPRITTTSHHWEHPEADAVREMKLHRYPLRLTSGTHDLTFERAVGRLVVARRSSGDDHFVLDPSALFGLALETGNFAPDPVAVQDSLF